MLLFHGKPAEGGDDENLVHFARLAALRAHFFAFKGWPDFAPAMKDSQTHAMTMALKLGKRLVDMPGDPATLVICAHGDEDNFNGFDAGHVAEALFALGIEAAGTRELWVAACNVGLQDQRNKRFTPTFTQQLSLRLRERMPKIVVHGPRGLLSFGDREHVPVGDGERTLQFGRVYITDAESGQEYPFAEGWVRANF